MDDFISTASTGNDTSESWLHGGGSHESTADALIERIRTTSTLSRLFSNNEEANRDPVNINAHTVDDVVAKVLKQQNYRRARRVEVDTLDEQHERLHKARGPLAQKKFDGTLTETEKMQLDMLDWRIDQVQLALESEFSDGQDELTVAGAKLTGLSNEIRTLLAKLP